MKLAEKYMLGLGVKGDEQETHGEKFFRYHSVFCGFPLWFRW